MRKLTIYKLSVSIAMFVYQRVPIPKMVVIYGIEFLTLAPGETSP